MDKFKKFKAFEGLLKCSEKVILILPIKIKLNA